MLVSACSDASEGTSSSTTEEYEGDEPGECEDKADNDRDSLFDCDDPDCAGAPVCKEQGEARGADAEQGSGEQGEGAGDAQSSPLDDVSESADAQGPNPSAEAVILELLAGHGCANVGCHDGNSKTSGLDVTTLEGLFAEAAHGPSVIPCEPMSSPLYTKLIDPVPFGIKIPKGTGSISLV